MTNNNIPIKIKNSEQANQQDIKKALNLNQVLADAKEAKNSSKSRFWPVVALILAIIALGLGARLFLFSQPNYSQYQKIIPSNVKAIILLNLSSLQDLAPVLSPELQDNSQYFRWLKDRIQLFLQDAGVSAQNDLLPTLTSQAAFMVLPSSTDNIPVAWVLAAQTKNISDQQDQRVFDKLQQELRRNFGVNQIVYRQTQINTVYSFNYTDRPYYWTRINSFILVGNELNSFQSVVDQIIGK